MRTSKKFVIVRHFEGEPQPSDLKLVEEKLPPIKDGEFLAEAEYLSVDPYMRKLAGSIPLGATMVGAQVAKIVESRDPDFPVGERVVAYFGWRNLTIVDMRNLREELTFRGRRPYILPDIGGLPTSVALGTLGMPGMTAYFGLLELCQPKPRETLVVTGAAGAVGSQVGQLGKIMGLKVIGIAGSKDKCEWIKRELNFDHAINYKTQDVGQELSKAAPEGIDCFFDNVGGEIATAIIQRMNEYGRIALCGSISSYNADPERLPKCTILQPAIVFKQLRLEGFIVSRWLARVPEGIEKNLNFIKEGKLKYRETITEGFENMFQAFAGMLKGENTGKAIVRA